ncbi:MAG: ribose 5-phosphate isomerase B [Clostridia bacterium]|nr:ribose 5-phosphate isomerase B [Clostridia bacterium]
MKIVIASDHGGYTLKNKLVSYMESMGHAVDDLGCMSEASVDYPDFGLKAAEAVARGEYDRGVVVCSTGIGISIAANKVAGIRCALCTDATMARLTREHNDANMLALGALIVGEALAKDILHTWLSTDFSQIDRHKARIAKITAYEQDKQGK